MTFQFDHGSRVSARLIAGGLSVLTVFLGCGNRDLHPVRGQVMFADGSPLSAGRVVVDYGNGKMSAGRISPDGSFRMGTLQNADGMKSGTYHVAVKDALAPTSETSMDFKILVHERFTTPATSGLEFTVPEQLFWKIVVEKP